MHPHRGCVSASPGKNEFDIQGTQHTICIILKPRVKKPSPRSLVGFRVQGSGFRVQGAGFRLQSLGFGVGAARNDLHVALHAQEAQRLCNLHTPPTSVRFLSHTHTSVHFLSLSLSLPRSRSLPLYISLSLPRSPSFSLSRSLTLFLSISPLSTAIGKRVK